MKVFTIEQIPHSPVTDNPLFTGDPVTRQPMLNEQVGKQFNMSVVNFGKGIRNKFHTHTSDQVLIVTRGKGIVADETEEKAVTVGDVAFIPAGERHWHGATQESDFAHVALTGLGSKTEIAE